MMKKIPLRKLMVLSMPLAAQAEMLSLEDSEMAGVTGQSGLVIDAAVKLSIDAISYFDDGNGISLKDIRISAVDDPERQARHHREIDVTAQGGILTEYEMDATRLVVGDIVLSDDPHRSLGSLTFDYTRRGHVHMQGYDGKGLRFNAAYELTEGHMAYGDDGNQVMLDDITSNVSIKDMILSVALDPSEPDRAPFISLQLPDYEVDYNVGAIRYQSAADAGSVAKSYGGIYGDYRGSTYLQISGGGREGDSGLSIDVQHQLHSGNFVYTNTDDAENGVTYELGLKDMTAWFNLDNLTVDVAPDPAGRLGLLLGFDQLEGELEIGSIEAPRRRGDGLLESAASFGSAGLNFRFADLQVGNEVYQNRLMLQGQGHADAGYQGITIQAEWSLPEARLRYTDDGNAVYLSGISSYGRGTVTVDVTREEVRNGTQFYDGLRLGFDNLKGGYRIEGLRVGSEDAPLQGGTELLLALGFYPSYDFNLSGHYTFAPGGAEGEGITINADIQVRDGQAGIAALRLDPNDLDEAGRAKQKGLWAGDLNYDLHLRDMTLDVTEEGIALVQAESWSTLDIGNLRVGDKLEGGSFGRFVFQRYQTGSSMVISPGGAGAVCVGGVGGDSSSCGASGGTWEDRGEQGVTIALKQIFAEAVDEERRNRFVWETGRQLDVDGRSINGTGVQMIVDNITTNDGIEGSNEFGFRNDLQVDVYQTKVVKKSTGVDNNGVYGEAGWEKIQDPTSEHGYTYMDVSPDDPGYNQIIANRPLGFAVKARTQFKELSVGQISLKHPNATDPTPALYGLKLQNFDITSNLTATPIQ